MIWTESIHRLRGLLSYNMIQVMRLMKCKISELCADLPRLKVVGTKYQSKANVLAWHFSHLPRLDRPWQGGGGNSSLADGDPTDAVLYCTSSSNTSTLRTFSRWQEIWSAHSTVEHAVRHASPVSHPARVIPRPLLKATCLDVGINAWCNAQFLQVLFSLHRTLRHHYRRLLLFRATANIP